MSQIPDGDPVSLEKQEQAFNAYRDAKLRFDETQSFADGRKAAEAWWKFLHVFERVTVERPHR